MFFLLNFLLYLSFMLFLYSFKKSFSFIDKLISAFLLYILSLISFFPFFGYFHFVNFYSFLFYILIISFILLIVFRKNFSFFVKDSKFSLFSFLILLKNPFVSFLFLLVFFGIFFILRFSYFHPPAGWDTYAYHLPISSRILIEGGIPSYKNFETFFIKPAFFFPKNVEFLFSYYYLFTNTLRGISVIHLLFLFFGILSLYSILRKFEIEKEKAVFSFILFFTPVIIQQSVTGYVDIETNIFFIIFLNFLIKRDDFSKFLSLLSLSLGAGTKYSFLPLFLIFLIYSSICYFKKRKYIHLIFAIIFSFFSSLHFYIFNYINTKSVFPLFEIKFFKFTLSKGEFKIDPTVFTFNIFEIFKRLLEFSKEEKVNFYLYDNRFGGFGPIFISTLFFIPIFILLFKGVKEKKLDLLKLFLFFFLFYLTIPYKWWTRFVIFLFFTSIFSYIYLWDRFRQRKVEILLSFLSAYSLLLGLNGIISPKPWSYLNNYKGKPFEKWIREDIAKSYFELSKYIRENDTIFVYKKGREEKFEVQCCLIGCLLEKSLFLKIEHVEDKKPHYKKIISSPASFFEGYDVIYRDNNLVLWLKR